MGSSEEGNPSHETQNEININLEVSPSSAGTDNDVTIVQDDGDDDDHHHHQKQDQEQDQKQHEDQLLKEDGADVVEAAIVEKLECLELQGNDEDPKLGEEGEKMEEEEIERVNREEEEEEGEEGKTQNYPLRPGAVDCTFYLKTGTCKFGLNCRFNHPTNRIFQPVVEKERGMEESNGVAYDTGKIDCKYFLTPGGCKYGDGCRYNHSISEKETQALELNFLGLPLRPSEKECTFYMRNGTCAYGAKCRFHHPDPTAAKESGPGNFPANGKSVTVHNSFHKGYEGEPLHSSGISHGSLSELSNGINSTSSLPYAHGMNPYHQGMPKTSGWNLNQVSGSLSTAMPSLPHQVVNNFSQKPAPSTHYEHLMQVEEFPERPGQPDCSYYLKTGDCNFRSNCRYNHPISQTPKLRLPSFSSKVPYSRSTKVSPVGTTELPKLNVSNGRMNGMPSDHYQQNEEFPERPGEPECEYFMKTGLCKFKSACRYHHPKGRISASSGCALNQQGLPLRPGSRTCRNYEQHGACRYGLNCLFHHPDTLSPTAPVTDQDYSSNDAAQDHTANHVAVSADLNPPVSSTSGSNWDDGWAM